MRIAAETILHIARLAQLELTPDEVERVRRDLDSILTYVEQLAELDTSNVTPTTHILDLATPLRDDEVRDVLRVDEVVRNAPEHTDSSMVVPKVLE
ncbi:MAG: Asp-tRNA(Asn)/Glu-tRNA(Gln) amidotransferase subunit GatC [Myxococcota bacterium]|jgi:aspartyl-tRNA(Asn)/glutamyl-tRNA(Gln) amidotransferase subunit C